MKSNSFPIQNTSTTKTTIEETSSNLNLRRVTLNFDPPVEDAPQKGRKHTAGRDGCPEVDKPLIALVPEWHLALAVAESPSFWFYIPYPAIVLKSAEMVLWDEHQNKIDEATVSIKNTPGIIKVRLPKTTLETGKRYRVDFSVTCHDGDSNTAGSQVIVTTWMKRVSLDANLASELQAATTPQDRYVLYAANGIWYEALTELAELHQNQQEDKQIIKDWKDFLNQSEINLPELISEPIVSCCTIP